MSLKCAVALIYVDFLLFVQFSSGCFFYSAINELQLYRNSYLHIRQQAFSLEEILVYWTFNT